MIARLTGHYSELTIDQAIIDVAGVGYHVLVPIGTRARLVSDEHGRVTLSVHTHVREDAIQLFGFASERDKLVFNKLTSVKGVGPKIALAVLSELTVSEVVTAVQRDDLARFTNVSGIGKKTAQRLLLELKNAFTDLALVIETGEVSRDVPAADDCRSALLNLGYKPAVVDDVIDRVLAEDDAPDDVEPLLRRALQLLS